MPLGSLFHSLAAGISRRDLFRGGALLPLSGLLRGPAAAQAAGQGLRIGPAIYESIGVRPVINCRGTFTIIGGSLELPAVRAAKESAAQHYVQLDELMDAVGSRLAELTGAEYGMVSAGCAAALTHTTAACVAGGNPDKHVRLPNLAGFAKDEVIIPKHSRNVYDAAIRAVGVRVVEVTSVAELESAIGPRTAMIYIFAGPPADAGPPSYDEIVRIAKERQVPTLVDAAAEVLTIPNVHLQRGATLVAYSGGKALRGPQCAGLLLGRKDLVRAAWVHSAPHHGYARAMKVGKEEIVGMLAAVEEWVKRDHQAEWAQWVAWLDHISKRVSATPGVSAEIRETTALSNRSPALHIRWDRDKLGIGGDEVAAILYQTEPRIALNGSRGAASSQTGISIIAHMMSPGEDQIVADRIHAVLSAGREGRGAEAPAAPAADLTGEWDVHIEFAAGAGDHTLFLKQDGNRIAGTHRGEFVSRELAGRMEGRAVQLRSNLPERVQGDALTFTFSGEVTGETMSGDLDMGEYLRARWSAKRHQYRQRA